MIGVFAATDVFLFYVFFEAMLIPMYFLIGSFGGPRRSYAAVKFLLYSLFGGLLMLASVIGLYVVSATSAGRRNLRLRQSLHPAHRPGGGEVALPRLLHRLRDQGAAVAVPHLAARRRRRGAPGGAVLLVGVLDKVGTFGLLRLLPAAVPRRVALLRAGDPRARGHRHPLRRLRGDRAARHEAARRLHLDGALRLHRARHLRLHQPGPGRLDAVHGQPRALDRAPVHRRRFPDRPPTGPAHRRLRRRAEGRARAGRAPSWSSASPPVAAGSSFVSEFLVLVGTFTRYPAGRRRDRSASSWPPSTSCSCTSAR